MARRGRPMGFIKKTASTYKRKGRMAATEALYEAVWGEKPKRGRPKKNG